MKKGERIPQSDNASQAHERPAQAMLLMVFVGAACVYLFFLEPWGHDTWYHLMRLIDIEQHLGRGELRAVFSDNAAQGKGLPVWVYYSQWIYWPAIALTSLGASPLAALKWVYGVFLIVCAAGLFGLLKLHRDSETAAFGALLFMTSNYVIGEIFTRSAYAEFLSVALLPLLMFCLHRTVVKGDRLAALAVVALSTLMILFHSLSFMNAILALLVYTVYVQRARQVPWRRLLLLIPLFALAFGLSAFYLLPAVIEMRYVQGANGVPTPVQETFLTIVKYLNFTAADNLGLVLDVLAAAVLLSLLLRRHNRAQPGANSPWPLLAGIVVYVFLTMRVSEPLYDNVPYLAANLWVSRFLFPLTLLVVILVVENLDALPDRVRDRKMLTTFAFLAVLQGAVFAIWRTADAVSLSPPGRLEISAQLAEDRQALDGFGVAEYLPEPRRIPLPPVECGEVQSMAPLWHERMMRFTLPVADEVDCVHIPRYWHPRYEAEISGIRVPVYGNRNGEILLVPAGHRGETILRIAEPLYLRFATLLSYGSAAIFLIGIAWAVASRLLGSGPTRSKSGFRSIL